MTTPMNFHVSGNLGTNAGAGADGILLGSLAQTNPTKVLLKATSQTGLCWTQDDQTFVDDTTDWGDAGANDVAPLPATPAVDDAVYFGHLTGTFSAIDINIGTQGAGTWTITWEYWDGSAWSALSGVTDGTTGFTATTGFKEVSFTVPGDWAKTTVSVSNNGYWVRARVSAYTSITTQPLITQGYLTMVSSAATYTDDLTDFTDAGANDCAALPSFPIVGDGLYIGFSEPFSKIELNMGTAGAGTYTITWKYWNGSAWTALSVVEDNSTGFTAGTSTYLVSFLSPSDWAANTAGNGPGGEAGYFIVGEVTAFTSMSTQPLITQGWIYPNITGAVGFPAPVTGNATRLSASAGTVSASNNDSLFSVINTVSGLAKLMTWTQAVAADSSTFTLPCTAGNEIVVVQVQEDGTTEFADANFQLDFVTT